MKIQNKFNGPEPLCEELVYALWFLMITWSGSFIANAHLPSLMANGLFS